MTDAEQIAAFIAARGVTRVAAGEATMDHRAMYRAVRGHTDNDLINQRRVVRSNGRDYVYNGLGEAVGIE